MDLACFGVPLSGLSPNLNFCGFVSIAMVEVWLVRSSVAITSTIVTMTKSMPSDHTPTTQTRDCAL
jgi:hypothetical protein